MNELFTLGGWLFDPSKGKHVPKHAESHPCEVNTVGIFACNFSMFVMGLQNLNGKTDFSQESF